MAKEININVGFSVNSKKCLLSPPSLRAEVLGTHRLALFVRLTARGHVASEKTSSQNARFVKTLVLTSCVRFCVRYEALRFLQADREWLTQY